jgi:deoxyribonuclease (pyrimidine dimer)
MIPVSLLTNVHLRAEYREVLMAPHFYKRSAVKGIKVEEIAQHYTLNQGHAKFFYNKMNFVKKRHDLLELEMIKRGYKIREHYALDLSFIAPEHRNDYEPIYQDYVINLERILQKIQAKPNLYKEKSLQEWQAIYHDFLSSQIA